jgi:two-component system, sensor histidine kinase LadS
MGLSNVVRKWLVAALLLIGLIWSAGAPARTVLDLDPAQQPVDLQDWGDAWLDESGKATAAKMAEDPAIEWTPTQQGTIYPLTAGQVLWVRFTVPPAPDAERWYLEIPYASVDKATLYSLDSAGQWIAQTAGDTIAVADWPVPHRHPLLPINVSAEVPHKFLLRIENPHSFSAPLSFVSESYLGRREQRTSIILGIYFGLAGLAVVLATVSAISLRDSAFGFYALSVTLMALSQAAISGIGGLHLWPHLAWWNDLSPLAMTVIAVGSLSWFFSAVLSMHERWKLMHQVLVSLGLLSVATALGIAMVEPAMRSKLMVPYILVAGTAAIGSIGWAALRGDRYAVWLFAGSAPVAFGGMTLLARLWGLMPISFWTTYAMQIGLVIELPVVLLILMVRSQHRREHNRRMQGFDKMDPATGLLNAQMFQASLTSMMARSRRLKYESAVLIIDVVNSEQIRRTYGTRSADELPLLVAGRLLSAARDIDVVARLSDLRFGMLIEGPFNAGEAAAEGPRIVARCLMPFKNKPIEWVAQVRVAQTVVPDAGAEARLVIGRLEGLLANVPPENRRVVFTLAD